MQRHSTATVLLADSHGRILLLWHTRLGCWMPPGGHVEEGETPEETARRECLEETGLDVAIIGDYTPDLYAHSPDEGRVLQRPLALLLEEIPAYHDQPAHQHIDFLYLGRMMDEKQSLRLAPAEARELRWFSLAEVRALPQGEILESVRRAVTELLPKR